MARQAADDRPVLLVGIANPDNMSDLMKIAAAYSLAGGREVVAVHVVTVPPQMGLGSSHDIPEMEAGRKLLSQAIEEGALQGVQVRGLLEAARDPVSGLLAAAESQEAESLLMGYSPPGGKEPGEEGAFDRLTHKVARETEAHLFIVKFRCPDITRILAVVDLQDDLIAYAELLRAVVEHTAAPVVFFHASDYEGTEEDIRAELEDKLEQAGLFDWGGLEIRKSGDPLAAIVERANQCDLTLINAAPRPSLMEAVFGSLPERVAAETESTVVLVRARSAEQTD